MADILKHFRIGEINNEKVLFYEGEPLRMAWMKDRIVSESHMKEIAGILASPYSVNIIRAGLEKIGYYDLVGILEDCEIPYVAFASWLFKSLDPASVDYNGRIIKIEQASTVLDGIMQIKNQAEAMKLIRQQSLGNFLVQPVFALASPMLPMSALEKKRNVREKKRTEQAEPIEVLFLDPEEQGMALDLLHPDITSTQEYDVDSTKPKKIQSGDIELDTVVATKHGDLKAQNVETELDKVFKGVFDKPVPVFTTHKETSKDIMRYWYLVYLDVRIFLFNFWQSFTDWCKYKPAKKEQREKKK